MMRGGNCARSWSVTIWFRWCWWTGSPQLSGQTRLSATCSSCSLASRSTVFGARFSHLGSAIVLLTSPQSGLAACSTNPQDSGFSQSLSLMCWYSRYTPSSSGIETRCAIIPRFWALPPRQDRKALKASIDRIISRSIHRQQRVLTTINLYYFPLYSIMLPRSKQALFFPIPPQIILSGENGNRKGRVEGYEIKTR